MAETVLLKFSFYLKLNDILNARIQLREKHENNLTIWVSLQKLCSSLHNLLPGVGSKKGQINLPLGHFKHFSNTGLVLKQITS